MNEDHYPFLGVVIFIALVFMCYEYSQIKNDIGTEIQFTKMQCPECGATLEFELIEREVDAY